jgi:transposase
MAGSKLNSNEQEKASILQSAIMGNITNAHAAKKLRLSIRQVQRVKAEIRKGGVDTIIHKLKGKPSNHAFPEDEKTKAIEIISNKYADFKPGFAAEKLQEIHDMLMTSQTIRVWMTEAGIWKTRKQKNTGKYRSWRPRKECFGEMEQFDGSYHLWFENRFIDKFGTPIETCLLAGIDDATGKITKAVFAANEGVNAVFTFWKEYVLNIGKPLNIYLDKFSTYKINHKSAVDNHELMTQFGRAMMDLAITLIPADSPQAKGRIERLFQTLQDRLIKEMRLANISNPKDGNKFLEEVFIPKFNDKFSVTPAKEGDIHKSLTDTDKLNINRIFSVQSKRVINNDFTIQFKNNWYQLAEVQTTTVRAREKVLVEEWLDGTIHFSLREKYLNYVELLERPKKVKKSPPILTRHKLNWKPPIDHPWRKPYKAKK